MLTDTAVDPTGDIRNNIGRTLSCGHTLTQEEAHRHGTHSTGVPMFTGYARDRDDRTMCYPCADIAERAAFLVAGMTGEPFTAYVDGAGNLTTWTGGVLATGIRAARGVSRSGWHGSEVHSWRFRTGPLGESAEWYGRNAGPGMVITVRRARHRSA
jgi:hypothetical protein